MKNIHIYMGKSLINPTWPGPSIITIIINKHILCFNIFIKRHHIIDDIIDWSILK